MTDSGEFDARPVRAFLPGPDVRVEESAWPASVPALTQCCAPAQPASAQAYTGSADCTRMPPETSTGGDWTKVGIPACQASLPLAVW